MTIEQQAAKVRKVKRAESGMIIDPVAANFYSSRCKKCYEEYGIGGIPIVDENQKLKNRNNICVLRR
jgi:IMP dehydrogenase